MGATRQFTKATNLLSPETVTWSVAGIPGGNSTVGTIDATGLYTAPAALPANNNLTVTATSTAMPAVSANATVYLIPPGPTITAAAPNPIAIGPTTVTITGAGFQYGAVILGTGGVQLSTSFNSSTKLSARTTSRPARPPPASA